MVLISLWIKSTEEHIWAWRTAGLKGIGQPGRENKQKSPNKNISKGLHRDQYQNCSFPIRFMYYKPTNLGRKDDLDSIGVLYRNLHEKEVLGTERVFNPEQA